jgi:hypothetical protein
MSFDRLLELLHRGEEDLSPEEFQEFETLQGERREEQNQAIPRPTCCEAAQKYPVVTFCLITTDDRDFDSDLAEGRWRAHLSSELLDRFYDGTREYYLNYPEVRYCTYCGESFPMMVRKTQEPKNPVCRVVGTSGYCATCNERLMACICDPPESRFEPLVIEEPLRTIPSRPPFEEIEDDDLPAKNS